MSALPAPLGQPLLTTIQPVAIWYLDGLGHLVEPGALPGRDGLPLSQGPLSALLAPAYRVLWEMTLLPALKLSGALDEVVLELRCASDTVQVLTFWRTVPGPGRATYEVVAVPATERARLLERLRRAQASLDAMPGAVLQLYFSDSGIRFPYASGGLLDLLGITCTQAMAESSRVLECLELASRQALLDALGRATLDGTKNWSVVLQPKGRPKQRIELSAQRQMSVEAWHCVVTDVSQREQLLSELSRHVDTDELTLLPNRAGLLVNLGERLKAHRCFAVLFMDCDRFKQVNDSLGHDSGDRLLRLVAQRLRSSLRPGDVVATAQESAEQGGLAARLGGDEFVVVADHVGTRDEVQALADRLVRTMGEPYQVDGHELVVTMSIGVVLADESSNPKQLLRDADTAMYEAKRGGRSRWVLFKPAMQQRVAAAMAMEMHLRHALAAGFIHPMFQPIVEMASGRIVGFEALARWSDPGRGHIGPAQFIPVAEESGQIAVLGESILRQACVQFAHWQRLGLSAGRRLSVNLSRAQLGDPALPQRVQGLLGELGMPPEALQLEVTETLAMANDGSLQVLTQLRDLGCRLSLDDFGIGHSSLAALHRLPVQQIKLDRSFICEIKTSSYHLAVVKAALQVAQDLDMEVVAEGVETEAQAQALAALGCTRAQGWLYAKAVDGEAALQLLRRNRLGG